jgi:hypothetical protein
MPQNSTMKVRNWWHLFRCSYGDKVPTGFFGRDPVYAQNPEHVVALERAHLAAGYAPTPGGFIGSRRSCPAGIGGKTCTENGKDCSLHNYGLAWDVEYNLNPHFRRRLSDEDLTELHAQGSTKYTPEIVNRILSVTNTLGEQMFGWLGYVIGDTMHWQINVPPERQSVDWSTVDGGTSRLSESFVSSKHESTKGATMYLPLEYGDGFVSNPIRQEDVIWLQMALHRAGFEDLVGDIDGKYGMMTAAGVGRLRDGGDGRHYGAVQHDDLLDRAYRS